MATVRDTVELIG